MKLLKQTGGLIAMEYGLLVISIVSAAIFAGNLLEANFDAELTAIATELITPSYDLTTGSAASDVAAVTG